jgi:hypothetical protein
MRLHYIHLLRLLVVVTLFAPYFTVASGLKIRFDMILLPTLVFLFCLRGRGEMIFRFNRYIVFYTIFYLWLCFATIIAFLMEREGPDWTSLSLLAGIESYLRPLFWLILASQIRLPEDEIKRLVRFILFASIPLCILGILQVFPATANTVNEMIFTYYSNSPIHEKLLRTMISSGRAMSVFAQVSTFGMFCLLIFCLSIITRNKVMRLLPMSAWLIVVFTSLIGGISSGSKVFYGGLIVFCLLSMIFYSRLRSKLFFGIVIFILIYIFSSFMFDLQLPHLFLVNFDVTNIWSNYFASRFGGIESNMLSGKIFRTGVLETFQIYPISGLGFIGVPQTTDSFLVGLLALGGLIGLLLYLMFLFVVYEKLWVLRKCYRGTSICDFATILLILEVIFFLVSIGFHTFIQDRAGDIFWLLVGLVLVFSTNRVHGLQQEGFMEIRK